MIKQMERYEYRRKTFQKTRTVRSCSLSIKPIISKHLIDFEVDRLGEEDYNGADNEESSSGIELRKKWKKLNQVYYETTLDRIIGQLIQKCKRHDILLMITPSSRHKDQYKLHAIEKASRGHLGMISVTKTELDKLRNSEAFQKFSIIIGTRYIDIKTVAVKSATINNLMNTMNGSCCRLTENAILGVHGNNNSLCKKTIPCKIKLYNRNDKNDGGNDINCNGESTSALKKTEILWQTDNESLQDNNTIISEGELLTLMEEISYLPRLKDKEIDRFFRIAEQHKFHIKIRPELCSRHPVILFNGSQNEHLCRFYLECFMPNADTDTDQNNRYLGSVLLDNELLQIKLTKHKELSENIDIIEDVYDMLPLIPTKLKRLLYNVLAFCGLEIFYDLIGEVLYEFYRSFGFR